MVRPHLYLRMSGPVARAVTLTIMFLAPVGGPLAGSRPDPRSLAYLDSLHLDRLEPIPALAGRQLRIIDRLPIPERSDNDFVTDLRSIAVTVSQVSGPPVAIQYADDARARATMPAVDGPTPIVFEVVMRNAGGERRGRLTVMVRPGR